MTEQPNAAATAEDRGALVRRSRIRHRRARRVPLLAPGSAGRWLGRLCGLAAIRRIALTDYPASFEPNQKLVVSVRLPMVLLPLQPGSDPSLVHDFGGKPLVDHNGTGMFAELAIQQMAEAAGWSARWVCTYGMKAHVPRFLTTWSDLPLDEQENVPLDAKQELLLRRIAKENNNSYSGCWDVVAWKGERTLFIEAKHDKKDHIRATQLQWRWAALRAGLKPRISWWQSGNLPTVEAGRFSRDRWTALRESRVGELL